MTGSCQCGRVRYRLQSDRVTVYACHCHQCQKQSGSAFGLSMPVARKDFEIQGDLASWERETESGARTTGWFCPVCGSRIFHQSSRNDTSITLKAGTLDDTSGLEPCGHLWVSCKQPWVVLDVRLPAWETQPADLSEWRALLAGSGDKR